MNRRFPYRLPAVLLLLVSAILAPAAVLAAWSANPHLNDPVCTVTDNQVSPCVCSDGAGGYLIAWIAIPEGDEGTTTTTRSRTGSENGRLIIGSLLVLTGISLLARQYLPWMQDLIMPAVFIGVGVGIVVYSLNK